MMTKWDGAEIDLPRENWGANLGNYKDPKEPLLGYIRSAVLLRLDPRKLAEPSFSEEIIPQTEFDGTNLAASLADMAIQTPDRYKTLIDKLRAIVPSILAVRFQKTSVESERFEQANKNGETLYRFVKVKTIAYQAVFDTVSGENISAPYTSEGTLLTLGLLSVIYGPAQPRLVLIDELERGLHPKALGILVSQIRDIQKEFPDLQVVATTHSPYLVDQFEANEVILTALRDDGSVGAARLSEHPDFERWKGEMASGEFWSTVGESWVIDRDAAKRS